MGVAYLLLGALTAIVMGGCLLDLSWRVPHLEGSLEEQLKRSAQTNRGAPRD